MDKAQLEQYLNSAKQVLVNIDVGTMDITTGIIVIFALILAWVSFKLGVKIGKQSLDYNHKLEVLSRVAKVFNEVNNVFPPIYKVSVQDVDNLFFKKHAEQLAKLAKVMDKDIMMWSMTAPTSYLDNANKLAQQVAKSAKNLAKTEVTNKMTDKKIKNIVKKQHNQILATYEAMVKEMRKDMRSEGLSKIIKNIIHS